MYDLKWGILSVIQFKSKFDEHIVYFSNWGESDIIDLSLHNLKDSIKFKVSAYSPKTLDEAHGLTMNFESEVNNMMERNKSQLGEKKSLESYYLAN